MNAVAEQSTGQGTGLTTRAPTGMGVFQNVDPMQFIKDVGRIFAMTKAGGAKTEADGQLLALACISENTTVFRIAKRYHLMEGKLVTKAEIVLADFRNAGGDYEWIDDGDDLKTASATFTYKGKSRIVKYTMEDAVREKIVKAGGGWEKNPGAMLRARCGTKAVKMLAPEILAGDLTAEELEDEPQQAVQVTVTQAPSAASVVGVDTSSAEAAAATKRKRRTAAEIAADKAAEEAAATGTQVVASTAIDANSEVIDATVEPALVTPVATTATTETPTAASPDSPGSITPASLARIGELAAMLGVDLPGLRAHLLNENPDFPEFAALSQISAEILIANLDQIANPKK